MYWYKNNKVFLPYKVWQHIGVWGWSQNCLGSRFSLLLTAYKTLDSSFPSLGLPVLICKMGSYQPYCSGLLESKMKPRVYSTACIVAVSLQENCCHFFFPVDMNINRVMTLYILLCHLLRNEFWNISVIQKKLKTKETNAHVYKPLV